jgi:GntR family transcriptional regulator/MocR family aminotransferase
MAERRANSGLDLHLDVDLRHPRRSLERALREAIRDGRLAAESRLPPSRSLAADLGIARNTIAEAYTQLAAEGWLSARQGSGTRVADRPVQSPNPAGRPRERASRGRARRLDLRPGVPDLAAFPRAEWSSAQRQVLATASYEILGYDPRGPEPARRAVADYLARVRGVRADPDRMVLTAGFTQGLRLAAEVLVHRGHRTVGVEAYGHAIHRSVLESTGLRPHAIAVDGHGAVVDELLGSDVRAAVLTPAHQFPIGSVLGAARRQAAVRWADTCGGYLIEDDYDGEFRYDRQPVGAVQALDPERVIYAGSVSKALAPGIRVGWLVLPSSLVAGVVEAKERADGGGSVLDQLTVARLIVDGGYDRIVRRRRLGYRRRRDRLVQELGARAPGARISGIAAGLHALLELPRGTTEAQVVAAAAGRGLRLDGLGTFAAAGHDDRPAVVVGYSRPPDHAFTTALARLVAAVGTVADS